MACSLNYALRTRKTIRKGKSNMRKSGQFLLFVSVIWFVTIPIFSAVPDSVENKITYATKIPSQQITLDGELSESVWAKAVLADNFTQRQPEDGTDPSQETYFKVLYDNEYIYVGIRAYDTDPDKVQGILTRRDEYTPSDWLYVSFDSFDDNRTAFEFGMNPAGVQHDLRRFDDGNADYEWDAVWEGAVNTDREGWVAEFAIPFRELRYTASDAMTWGLQVYREYPRNNELDIWNYFPKDESGWVSNYGALKGLSDVGEKRRIYAAPYLVGRSDVSHNLQNAVHPNPYEFSQNIGGDLRIGFRNGFTLNATINPDFGQVEADPSNFNLTAYETYFSEKRPFFMEGGNILNFSLGFGDGSLQSNSLFYSRRIGRAPQGDTDTDKDPITTEFPNRTTILGAAKLTGKTESGLSVGIMDAITSRETATAIFGEHESESFVVEPQTNYFVSRLSQDFRKGQTTIGGIVTATNRQINSENVDFLRREAYTGGLDIDHQFWDRKLWLQAAFAVSQVRGSEESMIETQRSSSRYFQRPDQSYATVDSSVTSLTGTAQKLVLAKVTGHYRGAFGLMGYGPGFEINDLGYLPSVNEIIEFIWLAYTEWNPTKYTQRYQINFNQWSSWDYTPLFLSQGGNVNAHATLLNNWRIGGGYNISFPGYSATMLRGGPKIYRPGGYNIWYYIRSDSRKNLSFGYSGNYHRNEVGGWNYSISPSVNMRPKRNIQLSLNPEFEHTFHKDAWVGSTEDKNGKPQYFFAEMKQQLLSLTIRADYTITPDLSIQYYAQPYLTAGKYSHFKRVDDRLSSDYNERFESLDDKQISFNEDEENFRIDRNRDGETDYIFEPDYTDFNFKQFNSNLVIRWEYTTGSVLYLVWSQGFTDYEEHGQFKMRRDLDTLFRTASDNVLLLKVSYMFNI